MFSSTIAFAALLAATATVHASPAALFLRSQCDTGTVSCCNNVQPAGSAAGRNALSSLLDIVVGAAVPIGIDCTPISALGLGSGGNCAATPVCCENNTSDSTVNISCVPLVSQL